MGFIENIRVSNERAKAGLCAQQDRPSTVFGTGVKVRFRVAEDASAQGDELPTILLWRQIHSKFISLQ